MCRNLDVSHHGLLAAVSFCVPWIKSVYSLKATVSGFNGPLTLGTLGYCVDNAGNVTCLKPSAGHKLGELARHLLPSNG